MYVSLILDVIVREIIYLYLCVEGVVGVVVVAGRAGRGVLTRSLRKQLLLQSDIHEKLYI